MSVGATLAALGWRRAWVVDTEYKQADGGLPQVHCVCALDLISGERREVWVEPGAPCPFDMSADELFIFFEGEADALAFIAGGWPAPLNVLDPRIIWKKLDNGARETGPDGKKKFYGLFEGADAFHIPHVPQSWKAAFRDLAIRGAPFTEEERAGLIRYCRSDVDVTAKLFETLWGFAGLDDPQAFAQALVDGRYTTAAARVYRNALPIDLPAHRRIFHGATNVRLGMIDRHRDRFPVHALDGSFSYELFGEFLKDHGLFDGWPRTITGRLSSSEATFKEMASGHPIVSELHHHLTLLEQLMSFGLNLGPDGRNRVSLNPFGTKTGRNAPRAWGNLLLQSKVFRPLIRPPPGRAMCSLDWSAQELRIAAYRSGDLELQRVANLPDPYIGLAASVGLAKPDDTRKTNPKGRAAGKIIQLAMMYGIGAHTFGLKTGKSKTASVAFLADVRARFSVFFSWSDAIVARAMLGRQLTSPLGWALRFRKGTSTKSPARTARNYVMQSVAADMMRLVVIRATEEGLCVCSVLHDGFFVEAEEDEIDAAASRMHTIMDEVSKMVIGVVIPVDVATFVWPNCYEPDDDDAEVYRTIMQMLEEDETDSTGAGLHEMPLLAGS